MEDKHIKKLPKAPLKEVIFELTWKLEHNQKTHHVFDSGFELAQGIFAQRIKEQFPFKIRLNDSFVEKHILRVPIWQFWKSKETYPLVQLGQGILTLNDTDENYVWEDTFLPNVEYLLKILSESYEHELILDTISLRYIDAIEISNNLSIYDFFNQNFKTNISANIQPYGDLESFSLNETYRLEDKSKLILAYSTGFNLKTQRQQLIWQNIIRTKEINVLSNVIDWLNNAHSVSSDVFKRTIKKELYESFQ